MSRLVMPRRGTILIGPEWKLLTAAPDPAKTGAVQNSAAVSHQHPHALSINHPGCCYLGRGRAKSCFQHPLFFKTHRHSYKNKAIFREGFISPKFFYELQLKISLKRWCRSLVSCVCVCVPPPKARQRRTSGEGVEWYWGRFQLLPLVARFQLGLGVAAAESP